MQCEGELGNSSSEKAHGGGVQLLTTCRVIGWLELRGLQAALQSQESERCHNPNPQSLTSSPNHAGEAPRLGEKLKPEEGRECLRWQHLSTQAALGSFWSPHPTTAGQRLW